MSFGEDARDLKVCGRTLLRVCFKFYSFTNITKNKWSPSHLQGFALHRLAVVFPALPVTIDNHNWELHELWNGSAIPELKAEMQIYSFIYPPCVGKVGPVGNYASWDISVPRSVSERSSKWFSKDVLQIICMVSAHPFRIYRSPGGVRKQVAEGLCSPRRGVRKGKEITQWINEHILTQPESTDDPLTEGVWRRVSKRSVTYSFAPAFLSSSDDP